MKKLYVSESTNRKIKEFNEAKKRGIHIPYVKSTFMSAGTRSIFWCPVQKRVITLMSQGEKHLYITKLFEPNVVEIKEQYPLDYVRTQEIADAHGVIHPRKHETGELTVVTTDLLITYSDEHGSQYRIAYTFKYSIDKRSEKRTNQKFNIEEAYWKLFGVRHEKVLRDNVSKNEANNLINFIHEYDESISPDTLREFSLAVINDVIKKPHYSLREALSAVALQLKISLPTCTSLFANAILKKILAVDLKQEIGFHKPIALCSVNEL